MSMNVSIPDFAERCHIEMTRDVVFLLQRRRWIGCGPPAGSVIVDGNVYKDLESEEFYTFEELAEMQTVDGMNCVREYWETDGVFLSREEGDAYGEQFKYRYSEGWRVYGVPAEGKLIELLKGT